MAKTPPFSLCNEFCVGGGGGASNAKDVKYDNKNSGLKAGNVNDAIDELYAGMGDVGSAKNPDYNQNDATQSDYIKNRPFYVSTEIVCDLKNILPGETQKRAYENYVPQIGDTLVFMVECDGETSSKEVTISQFPTLVNDNFNACKLYSDGFVVSTTESTGISIRVEKPGEIVKLDEKFIPDTIARTADVEVKAKIDDNGVLVLSQTLIKEV